MVRSARPSDIFGVPGEAPPTEAPPPTEPPRRRVPAWAGIATLIVIGGALAALGAGGGGDQTISPTVDVVREDHAVRALALYGEERATIESLQRRHRLFTDGGTADAYRRAAAAQEQVRKALRSAQREVGADLLAAAYWNSGEHPRFAARLNEIVVLAGNLQLLSATHETLYSGTAQIAPEQAHQQLISAFGGGPGSAAGTAVARWAEALLDELEGRERVADAVAARAGAEQLWQAEISSLSLPAVAELRGFVAGLPPGMVAALKGHPVAGPQLRHLERPAG